MTESYGATPEARIRNLHQQYLPAQVDFYCCGHCNMISGGGYIPWPCDTILALEEKTDDRTAVRLPEPHEEGVPLWLVGALRVSLTTEGVHWPSGEYGAICDPFWAEELGLAMVAAARAAKESKYEDSKLPDPHLAFRAHTGPDAERRRQRLSGDGRRSRDDSRERPQRDADDHRR